MTPKKQVFSKVKAVKDAAREIVGTPKSTRAIPDAKTRQESHAEKHKKPLQELLDESEKD